MNKLNLISKDAWTRATFVSLMISLSACGGGGGSDNSETPVQEQTPSTPPSTPAASPAPSTEYAESVVATAILPNGLSGDGEHVFLDATDAARGDDNDSPFNAFALGSQATAVGVVMLDESDKRDFFSANLQAGQWLTLASTQATSGNADLYVYDSNMQLINAGMAPSTQESIQVTSSAHYYIEVAHVALSRATVKYRLDVLPAGQQPSAQFASAASYSFNPNMIPGQVIVSRRDHAGLLVTETVAIEENNSAINLKAAAFNTSNQDDDERRSMIANASTRQLFDTLLKARALEALPEVLSAEPDQLLYATGINSNDTESAQQWGAELVDVEGAWSATEGNGVTVAVLDTAFLPQHPDLAGRMRDAFDFVDNDSDVQANTNLGLHHGTHVAGIIAAAANNNAHIAGVAPKANIMPLRVLGDCLCGAMSNVIQGLRYAAGLPNSSGQLPQQTAAVANLSLQLPYGRNEALIQNLEEVTDAGTTVVWAAGNDSDRFGYDEAGLSGVPGVVIVAAIGSFQKLSRYSNYGSVIDIAAPGGDSAADNGGRTITSLNGIYSNAGWVYSTTRMQGTSQAAPFVAGVLALMASVWTDMSPAAVDALIESGQISRDLGVAGNDDYYGAGLLDASLAVQTALAQQGNNSLQVTPKRIIASPSELSFGAAIEQIEVEIYSTDEQAAALNLQYAPSWLTVTPSQTEDGYGTWTITVNRDALGSDNQEDVLQFANNERQLFVPVSAHNPEQSGRSTGIAQLLVQFFNNTNGALVHQEYAIAEAGHRFVLASNNVPAGTYRVMASSDFDNDQRYCEVGEICGYINNSPQAEIIISANQQAAFELSLNIQ